MLDLTDSVSDRSELSEELDQGGVPGIRKIPVEADFLFAYSTVPGNIVYRSGAKCGTFSFFTKCSNFAHGL